MVSAAGSGGAQEEMRVHVATASCQGNVVTGTPERLRLGNLAGILLVAVVGVLDVRREHEGLAATARQLASYAFDMEVPETAAWHFVNVGSA